jgi:uncharacterized protein YgiB involved in biofilm formation
MKRSTACKLILMGVAPIALGACSSKPEVSEANYKTVEECTTAGNPQAECQKAFDKAQADQLASSPHYKTREDCIRDYGEDMCQPRVDNHGSSFFGPLMTGFLIGRIFQNNRYVYVESQPIYRTRDGRDYQPYTSGGGYGGFRSSYSGWSSGKSWSGSGGSDAGSHAITESRGGFGSASAARGGWGG